MKTQLLQDFDESGSAAQSPPQPTATPAPTPATAQSAAVWRRPPSPVKPEQRAAAGQMRPPGAQDMQGGTSQAQQSRQHAAAGAWTGPRPLPPDARMAAAGAPPQPQARAAVAPPDPAPTSDMPDWLAERLREDADQEAQRQRSRRTARRALAWSGAATVAAMLAVTGYWFYQESRVEGALNVVANTTPAAPAAPAPALAPTLAPVPAPASAPVAAATDAPPPAPPVTAPSAPEDTAPARSQMIEPMPQPAPQPAAQTAPAKAERPPHHARAPVHRKPHNQAETQARATVDTGPTAAQRREETLMQCRVLGYNERECRRRGCMMTRFGLACPG